MSKQTQLLLLEDVYKLGKSGDLVKVKTGFARNFLVPMGKGLVASKHTLRMQARLQEERAKQAAIDLEESKAVAAQLEGLQFAKEVKVDPDGHMYGSVSVADILELLSQSGLVLEKHNIALAHPIKSTGTHEVPMKLKEGVTCSFKIKITAEGAPAEEPEQAPKAAEEKSEEESAEEA